MDEAEAAAVPPAAVTEVVSKKKVVQEVIDLSKEDDMEDRYKSPPVKVRIVKHHNLEVIWILDD